MCPTSLAGKQHSLVQAGLIHGLPDSAESVQPPLATLALVQEVPDRLFDQFIAALKPAAGQLLLDLLSQFGWQRDLHGRRNLINPKKAIAVASERK